MSPIRVLVVDDSPVVRKIVTTVIDDQSDLVVVGTAADGAEAVEAARRLRPDVMTLDVEMPRIDGIDALRELRRQHLVVPTIMFSTATTRGATATLEALALGAADVVAKPSGVADLQAAVEGIRTELLPRLRALGTAARRTTRPNPSRRRRRDDRTAGPAELVCIGVSTGGPRALETFLPRLPAGLGIPVLVVQHMPPAFTGPFAGRLDDLCALPVREATTGAPLVAGQVLLAPGGRHLAVRHGPAGLVVGLTDGPPENACRPAVDVLFRTAAACAGPVLAVVMTGLGRDGTRGARAVRRAGGTVLVQDADSSVVWGMPGSVVQAGLEDAVVALDDLPAEVVRRTSTSARAVADAAALHG